MCMHSCLTLEIYYLQYRQINRFEFSFMRQQSLIIIILTCILINTYSTILSLTSTSDLVGNTNSNYTFQISNITNAAKMRFIFQKWSFLRSNPYSSSTKCFSGTTQLAASLFSNQIQCTLTTSGINQTLSFTLTNMLNPSSTKPYFINASILSSGNSQIVSYNYLNSNYRNSINATKIPNITFSPNNYSTRIGSGNSNVGFNIQINNYIDSNTVLYLHYNSSLINPIFSPTPTYNVTSTSGSTTINSWTPSYLTTISSQGFIELTGISITNPSAAISFTISGIISFIQNGINYTIQTVSSSITLSTISFTNFTLTSPLAYGTLNSIDIVSSCSIAQVNSNNASNPAYSTLSYNSSLFFATNSSNCSYLTTNSCRTVGIGSYRLSNFQTAIDQSAVTSITLTSFTFYQGAYYSLCRSTFNLSLTTQKINPSILISQCDNNETNSLNSINVYISLGSALFGDIIYLHKFKGIIKNTDVWSSSTINNQIVYQSTLSTNYYTNSSTNMNLIIPLTYLNQNQTTQNIVSKVELYRLTTKYAQTNSTLSLCNVTKGKTITSFSLTSTNSTTYSPTNISISASLQIFDYSVNDSIRITFISSSIQKEYVLSASLLSLNFLVFLNSVQCKYTLLNNYDMIISFSQGFSLPTISRPNLVIQIQNMINPAIVGTLWIKISTYDQNNLIWIKQELTTSVISITPRSLAYSIQNVYLLKNNAVSLSLFNANRQILTVNNILSSTTISVTLPSTILCSNYNNGSSVTSIWNYHLNTITNNSIGNITNLSLQFGNCFIKFFSNSITIIINETLNGAVSTMTSVTLGNICGDNCYECNSTFCTACFNSTNSNYTLLYNGNCFNACPAKSYIEGSICIDCHLSCSSCNGKNYLNCTKCETGYSLVDNYCKSICGNGKYQNNLTCQNCHPNCQSCVNSNNCYICKQNATLIENVCEFTICFDSCLTCLGIQSSCTSCISDKYLYLSQCLSQCPDNSYKKQEKGILICQIITQSAIYMPVSICGLVCVLLIIGLREYSNKKIGNQSRRIYQSNNSKDVNYKINILRLSSIVFSYLEIIAAIVLLAKNHQYQIQQNIVIITAVGLILHFLSNLAFLIGFVRAMCKKVVSNQGLETISSTKSHNRKMRYLGLRFKLIIALSSSLSLRTYKILYANLFLERTAQKPRVNRLQEIQQNNIGNNNIENENKLNNKEKDLADYYKSNKLKDKKNQQDIVPSKKLIRVNSLGDEELPHIQITSSVTLQQSKEDFINHQLTHPFLTYLTIITLFTGSLAIIIASSLEIYKSSFLHMLLWGLDCLLVTICSFGLTSWDLWIFTNLLKEEQNSEMSSKEQQERVNNTHQNLKQQIQVDIKISPQRQEKSPKARAIKNSYYKPRLSKRSQKSKDEVEIDDVKTSQNGSRRKKNQDIKIQNIPILKMFDDFEQQIIENTHHQTRQTKSKKFATSKDNITLKKNKTKPKTVVSKNNRYAIANDIYVNFQTPQIQNSQSKYPINQHSIDPSRSVKNHQIKFAEEFSEQSPIFPDISEIQQAKVQQAINQSAIDEMIQNNERKQLDCKDIQQVHKDQ